MSVAARLKQKLKVLRELDPKCEVFGARHYQYRLNPCITIEELENFEATHHIILPEDYRYFLLNIGNGGAGPGYGLHYLQNAPIFDLDKPFPFTEQYSSGYLDDYFKDIDELDYIEPIGSIKILTFGCSYNALLVVTGTERGNIWFHDEEFGDCHPIAYQPDHSDRFSLLAWYEQWLDVHIYALRNREEEGPRWGFGEFSFPPRTNLTPPQAPEAGTASSDDDNDDQIL